MLSNRIIVSYIAVLVTVGSGQLIQFFRMQARATASNNRLGDSAIIKIEDAPMSIADKDGKDKSTAVSTLQPLDVSSMEMVNCHILVPRFLAQSWTYGWQSDHKLVLVGNTPSLGSWDASKGAPLILTSVDKGESYSAEVMLPLGAAINAKIVAVSSKGVEEWEGGENRTFTLHPPSSTNQGSDLNGGGFLVMLHHGDGSNSSQVTYFPPFPAIDETQVVKLSTKALCRFTVPHKVTQVGEYLILVGSLPQLGEWNPEKGVQLTSRGNNVWSTDLILPSDVSFEAKVVLCKGGGGAEIERLFESGSNRSFDLQDLLMNHFQPMIRIERSIDEDDDEDERVLHPLCLFTCNWGVDETSVIVGSSDPKAEDVNTWPVTGMSLAQIEAMAAEWQSKLNESEANANKAYRAYEGKLMGLEALLEDQKYVDEQQLLALQKELLEEQDNLRDIEDKLQEMPPTNDAQTSSLQLSLDAERSKLAEREAQHRDEVLALNSEIKRLSSQLDQARSELLNIRSKMSQERQEREDELMSRLAELQASLDKMPASSSTTYSTTEVADAAIEVATSSSSSAATSLPDPRGKLRKAQGKNSTDAALKATHASEILRLNKSHSADMAKLKKEHEEKVKALEADKESTMQSLTLKMDDMVKESASSNQAVLEQQQREQAEAIKNLTTQYELKMKGDLSMTDDIN